jgi:hypothetical protein
MDLYAKMPIKLAVGLGTEFFLWPRYTIARFLVIKKYCTWTDWENYKEGCGVLLGWSLLPSLLCVYNTTKNRDKHSQCI